MRVKLLVATILAGFAFALPAAHAESAVVEAVAGNVVVVPKPSTQVAYPPKCHAYPVPRYCRRW